MNKKVLCIIPARGGSKGVPKKNIKLLAGKPLIFYSIEEALKSKWIDKVVVVTDDKEIAETVKKEFDIEIIDEPKELATDTVNIELVLQYAVNHLDKKGYKAEYVVLAQPTTPFRTVEYIDEAIRKVISNNFDSCLSVYPFKEHEFFWVERGNGEFTSLYNYKSRPLRQALKQKFRENGAVYVMKRKILMDENCRLGGKIAAVVMPAEISIDIDTQFDFEIADRIMRDKNSLIAELEKKYSGFLRGNKEKRKELEKELKILVKKLAHKLKIEPQNIYGLGLERLYLKTKRAGDRFFIALPPHSEEAKEIIERHKKRYEIAAREIKKGDVVVDCACGSGYAAEIFAKKFPKKMIGIDSDKVTIEYAKSTYGKLSSFYVGDILELVNKKAWPIWAARIKEGTVDVFVAIETLEHIPTKGGKAFIEYIRWILKEGGTAIISTPLSTKSGPSETNEFHVLEYNKKDFQGLLNRIFGKENIKYISQDVVLTGDQKRSNVIAFCTKK